MFKLKPLSEAAIPSALEKAKHYRLLNEPRQAESICRDILEADAKHQAAMVTLILALTDQFGSKFGATPTDAKQVLGGLENDYERAYYAGMIHEREAKAALTRESPHSRYIAYDGFVKAMSLYEEAEKIHPQDNEDAILRWNTCARMITQHKLEPHEEDDYYEPLLD